MPESTFFHPLFGSVRFATVANDWTRGGKIVFLSGFDESESFLRRLRSWRVSTVRTAGGCPSTSADKLSCLAPSRRSPSEASFTT